MVMLSDTSFSNIAQSKASAAQRWLALLTNHFLKPKSEFLKLQSLNRPHLITQSFLFDETVSLLDFKVFFGIKIFPTHLPPIIWTGKERRSYRAYFSQRRLSAAQTTEHEAAIPHGPLIAGEATQSRNCKRKFNMASQWSLIFIQMRRYWIHRSEASCIQMIDFSH